MKSPRADGTYNGSAVESERVGPILDLSPTTSLTAVAHPADNYIALSWTNSDSSNDYVYMVTKRDITNNETSAQTIPLKSTSRVLNIYPGTVNGVEGTADDASAALKTWMETDTDPTTGYPFGQGNVTVTSASIEDFNAAPGTYLTKTGDLYDYDVVFVGSWDRGQQ